MASRISVCVIDAPVEELAEKVASREVDLAVGPDWPVGPEVERVMLYLSLLPWVVWCAPRQRFARMRSVTWADLS